MKQQFVTYKGIQLAYSETGKGSAVVLLHGFLENSLMWKGVVSELSKKAKVICIDLLGHGKSDSLGYVHTMDEMAEAVKFILKHLKTWRITLVGHSMGGYVSLAFAERYPKNVKKICLVNSTAQPDNEERKKLRLRAIEMAKTNYKNLVSMSIVNLFRKDTREEFLESIETTKKEALKTTVQGYIAAAEGMRLRPNREHILANKEFKRLMIIGKKDPILNYESLIDEAKRTNTPTIEFSNGHMSHIENKSELLETLRKFI